MADAGCQCVYVVDSAGALVLDQVVRPGRPRWSRSWATTRRSASTATRTWAWAWPTRCWPRGPAPRRSTAAPGGSARAPATPRWRRSSGVCDKLGYRTGIDFFAIVDAAEDVVRPAMPDECKLDRMALIMGYAGVYSSFLMHAFTLAERYRVSGAEILVRAGERRLVGGQEDQLIDIAVELSRGS